MTHAEKWNEVCEELKEKHPKSDVTLWVSGYVFGLSHGADTASRSRNTADSAKPPHTPSLISEDSGGGRVKL